MGKDKNKQKKRKERSSNESTPAPKQVKVTDYMTSQTSSPGNQGLRSESVGSDCFVDMDHLSKISDKLDHTNNEIAQLRKEVTSLVESLKYSEKQLADTNVVVEQLKSENAQMREHVYILDQQNKILNDKMTDAENYSRKENILICGVQESRDENCFFIACDLFRQLGGTAINIQRCHRVGPRRNDQPRDIICRLLHYSDKVNIMRNRHRLPPRIYINDDFAPTTRRRCAIMRPVFKEAQQVDQNAMLNRDKLRFQGRNFNVENVHQTGLNLTKLSEKHDENILAFSGRFSMLSNLYPCRVEIDNQMFNSSEHAYQYKKCVAHGNHRAAAAVVLAQEPEGAMAAGSEVKATDEWKKSEGMKLMKTIVHSKCKNNKQVRDKLVSTESKVIVEATRNRVWGVGVTLRDKCLQTSEHQGENIMGTILMELRTKLTSTESDDQELTQARNDDLG